MKERRQDERIDYLVSKVDSIFDILKGKNGDPGMLEEVRNNRRDIDELKQKPIFIARYWQLIVSTGMFIVTLLTAWKMKK